MNDAGEYFLRSTRSQQQKNVQASGGTWVELARGTTWCIQSSAEIVYFVYSTTAAIDCPVHYEKLWLKYAFMIYCNMNLLIFRGYCSRRLRRLRKALGFKMGNRHKFIGKKITVEMLSDNRWATDDLSWSITRCKLVAVRGSGHWNLKYCVWLMGEWDVHLSSRIVVLNQWLTVTLHT